MATTPKKTAAKKITAKKKSVKKAPAKKVATKKTAVKKTVKKVAVKKVVKKTPVKKVAAKKAVKKAAAKKPAALKKAAAQTAVVVKKQTAVQKHKADTKELPVKMTAKEHNRTVNPKYKPVVMLNEFMQMEAAGGMILVFFAIIAMIVANSPLAEGYHHLLHETKGIVGIGPLVLEKDLIHWINDGLMAIFFFLVGLEIKREVLEGALSTKEQLILPIIAAIGGMVAPGLIYYALNGSPPESYGWATPTATDIAFAIGVLSLLGNRVPVALKVFLLALAIIDDLGAIVIIAIFYTENLQVLNLAISLGFVAGLIALNRFNVSKGSPYFLLGLALWICVLKSGVHATLAGVITALTIPLCIPGERRSLLRQLEHDLNSFVAFFILPCFAFANAGISLEGVTLNVMWEPVTLGVILGLVIGKPLGITGFTWVFTALKIAKLPKGINMLHVFAISCLGGIGFTMSIFIGTLGFLKHPELLNQAKLGILVASVIAAVVGLAILAAMFRRDIPEKEQEAYLDLG